MTAAAFFPWVILAFLFGKKGVAAAAPASAPTPAPAGPKPAAAPTVVQTPTGVVPAVYKPTPQPWPQAVPAGLPAFPGPQWVPDNPPGAGVVSRATQLIPTLWARGAGTFKCEQTAGRWICYRATPMGTKKGVVAFKLATEPKVTVAPPAAPTVVPAPAEPGYKPVSVKTEPPAVVPATTTAPQVALATLRLKSPRMTGPDVVTLQKRLGLTADGVFGSGTHAAVIAYQNAHGLTPDGIVGPRTWGSLFGRSV